MVCRQPFLQPIGQSHGHAGHPVRVLQIRQIARAGHEAQRDQNRWQIGRAQHCERPRLNGPPLEPQPLPRHRKAVEITPFGLHWAELDEDISVPALLDGKRAHNAA